MLFKKKTHKKKPHNFSTKGRRQFTKNITHLVKKTKQKRAMFLLISMFALLVFYDIFRFYDTLISKEKGLYIVLELYFAKNTIECR